MEETPLEELSAEQANEFLEQFKTFAAVGIKKTIEQAKRDGVLCDYSLDSLGPLLRWVYSKLVTEERFVDDKVPEWIRDTDSYKKGLFKFDQESNVLVLRAAYYLGEVFVRNFDHLTWSIGDPDFAEKNMPVVAGFKHDLELAPVLVVKNLMRRAIRDPEQIGSIEVAVKEWVSSV